MNPAIAELTLTFDHRIYYSNKGLIPAEEVGEALLALSRMVHRTPQVLKAMVPGSSLAKVEVFVEQIKTGSLDEEIKIHLLFGSKRKMQQTLKKWRKALGIDLTKTSGVIRTILIALVLLGGYYAASNLLAPKEKATVEISHNTIINIGAKELNLPAEELVKIIQAAIPNKAQLANDAVKIVRPAKREPKAEIRVDGDEKLTITAEEIAKIPNIVVPDKSEESETKENEEIHLRALDLDSSEKGWAAVVPTVSPRRMRLELGPGIKPDDLFGKKTISGTVEVIKRKDAYDRWQLRSYRLVTIDPEE